ncbi:hypothetical protein Leryth_009202 [Lithospermum erythrorhizon]|nr:hypothetical protein Leryth_009202 [Lithospermum erythrorhizon]
MKEFIKQVMLTKTTRRPINVQLERTHQSIKTQKGVLRREPIKLKRHSERKPYRKHILKIPSSFEPLLTSYSARLIKLLDADNNEWVVCYICESLTHALTQGWIDFMRDKNLTVGDTCTFERVCGVDEIKLKMTISKFVK